MEQYGCVMFHVICHKCVVSVVLYGCQWEHVAPKKLVMTHDDKSTRMTKLMETIKHSLSKLSIA